MRSQISIDLSLLDMDDVYLIYRIMLKGLVKRIDLYSAFLNVGFNDIDFHYRNHL